MKRCYDMLILYCCEFGVRVMIFSFAKNLRTYRFCVLAAHAGTDMITQQSLRRFRTIPESLPRGLVSDHVCSCVRNAAKACFA
jgi:hypothetical protein